MPSHTSAQVKSVPLRRDTQLAPAAACERLYASEFRSEGLRQLLAAFRAPSLLFPSCPPDGSCQLGQSAPFWINFEGAAALKGLP